MYVSPRQGHGRPRQALQPGDRFFPILNAQRLAGEVGGAKLVEIPDSATFIPLDQPERLAAEIADFAPLR